MKVWMVINEQHDERGNVCGYSILGVFDTYLRADKLVKTWLHYWGKAGRRFIGSAKDMYVSANKYGLYSVLYIEEREVK